MSLSFTELKKKLRFRPDRVEVLFAPGRLALRRQSAREGAAQHDYPVSENSWQAANASLGQALNELGWRDASTSIRLSNHFVRYALVPGSAKLRNRAERTAAARHQLRALYGEHADRWTVVPAATDGDSHLAAAVDGDLLAGLAATALGAGLKLRRIEPLLVDAFNNARARIDRKPTWLITAEAERVCIAHFDNGRWRLIRNERLRAALAEELPLMLDRLALAENVQPGRVVLVGAQAAPALGEGWSVEMFEAIKKKAA